MKFSTIVQAFLASALSQRTIVDAQNTISQITDDPIFSILKEALEVTGLYATLNEAGNYTVFAPTNNAFGALNAFSPGTLNTLLAQSPPDILTSILLNHVLDEVVTLEDIQAGTTSVETLAMETLTIIPPTNTEPAFIDGVAITQVDIQATNGIVHILDQVLLPSDVTLQPGIVAAANATGQFSTLLSLIDLAQLSSDLNNPGPLTVFAPTDDAFAAIPNLEELAGDMDTVIGILINHVVGGLFTADTLTDGQVLTTLAGSDLVVSIMDGSVMVGNATVVQADILGSNGVVHAIDSVLIPENPNAGDDFEGFPTAAPVAGVGNNPSMPTPGGAGGGVFENPPAEDSGAAFLRLTAGVTFAGMAFACATLLL